MNQTRSLSSGLHKEKDEYSILSAVTEATEREQRGRPRAGGGTVPALEDAAGREETLTKSLTEEAELGKEEHFDRRTASKAILGRKSFSLCKGKAMENSFKNLVALENKVDKWTGLRRIKMKQIYNFAPGLSKILNKTHHA